MPKFSEPPPVGEELKVTSALDWACAEATPGTTKSIIVPWVMLMMVRGALGQQPFRRAMAGGEISRRENG